jgi:hypothetical protein
MPHQQFTAIVETSADGRLPVTWWVEITATDRQQAETRSQVIDACL